MRRSNRQVPLILNEDVEGIGFAGELVRVKAGFARNYLLPRKLAAQATPKLQAERRKEIAAAEARRGEEVAAREATAQKLSAEPLALTLKVGPGGRVFGSITAAKFADAVKEQRGVEVDPRELHGVPISGLGTHTVSAKLGLGVAAHIPVRVTGEAAQVQKDPAAPAKAEASATL